MNKELTELLAQLSAKLGVTVEYLWAVLIKQAYINAWQSLFYIAIAGLVTLLCFQIIQREKRNGNLHEFPTFLCAITILCCMVAFCFNISDVFNGFLNPEYWALNKIISSLE